MVHELIGIQNGRVDLSLVPDIRSELKVCFVQGIRDLCSSRSALQEVTLTTSTDPFFQAHHLATFGDLGTSLKSYVQSYQSRSLANAPSSINSITDMKRFVEEYPEFRRLGGNVSKHVAIVGELSRLVERDKLLEVGEVEQGLATGSGADLKVSTYKQFRAVSMGLTPGIERSVSRDEQCHPIVEQAPFGYIVCVAISEDPS